MKNWEKLNTKYLEWLEKNNFRRILSKKSIINGLSLWWTTNLCERDVINNNWYYDLYKVFFKKKLYKKKFNNLNFFFLFFKSLIRDIFFNLIIKFLFTEKKIKNINNCFFSYVNNIELKNHKIFDRQYQKLSNLVYDKKDNIFLILLGNNFKLIFKFFLISLKIKKTNLEKIIIVDTYISFYKIFSLYILIFRSYFYLKKNINLKKNYIINNIDCSYPLKNELIKSFAGYSQYVLIKGFCMQNFLKGTKIKNFINYLEFYPLSRSFYFFIKKNNINTKILTINHANFSKNNFFLNVNKNEFSKKNNSYYCSSPDVFFCQGLRYYNFLKKTFPQKKKYLIGSLKIKPNLKKIKKIKLFNNKKKIITIFTSIKDYKSFVILMNECNLSNYNIILQPHPLNKNEIINYFKKNFKNNFYYYRNYNSYLFIKISNYIIFGDSSIGIESSVLKKNAFRVIDRECLPTFDLYDNIPTATDKKKLMFFLNKLKIEQPNGIAKTYFYKYDMSAEKRLKALIN